MITVWPLRKENLSRNLTQKRTKKKKRKKERLVKKKKVGKGKALELVDKGQTWALPLTNRMTLVSHVTSQAWDSSVVGDN